VVLEVVGHRLVIPAQHAGRRVEVHRAVAVEQRLGVRDGGRSRLVRVADAERHRSVGADEGRLPGAARAYLIRPHCGVGSDHRVELPDQHAGPGVQSQQDAAARSVAEGAGQVDPSADRLGLDTERTLASVEQTPVDPERLAGCRAEREGRVRRVPVHAPVRDRDAVWPGPAELRGVDLVLPSQLAGGEIERVHVRLHVLDVDDTVDHDRRHIASAWVFRRDRRGTPAPAEVSGACCRPPGAARLPTRCCRPGPAARAARSAEPGLWPTPPAHARRRWACRSAA
jgi:hypothetical protein